MTDTDGKTKTYKHPERGKPANYKPYVPQYQVHGKEPSEYHGAVVPNGLPAASPSTDNPRLKRSPLRQPYSPATESPIGRGRGPIPNVGNNMEQTWSSSGADGDIIDDLSGEGLDPNHPMIDNNEFVSNQALGFQAGPMANEIQTPPPQGKVLFENEAATLQGIYEHAEQQEEVSHQQAQGSDDLLTILSDLTDDSFLLIVAGVPLCSGPKEEIEDQARALVFGEHEMCDGNPIPVDDIIILKRVKVRVGLFLE